MKIDYLLTGLVNENYVEVVGHGHVDRLKGESELHVEVKRGRDDYDPGVIILVCCENLRFFTADLSDKRISVWTSAQENLKRLRYGGLMNNERQGAIHSKDGEELALVKAKGFLFVEDEVAYSRTVIKQAYSKLNALGGIRSISVPYSEDIFPMSNRSAQGVSRYNLVVGDGTTATGQTVYPYLFEDGCPVALSTLPKIRLDVTRAELDRGDYAKSGKALIRMTVKGIAG